GRARAAQGFRCPAPATGASQRALRKQAPRRDQGGRSGCARDLDGGAGGQGRCKPGTIPMTATPPRNQAVRPEVHELKFTLHRKLLDKINLEALALFDAARARQEVQQALFGLMDKEPTLLTSAERDQIADEVLHEVFGLGPIEALLDDSSISDILVNGAKTVYVERAGLLERTNVQ